MPRHLPARFGPVRGATLGTARLALLLAVGLVYGCMGEQIYSTSQHQAISLRPGELSAHGLAVITPSSVTGQEEDKQALALTFAEVLKRARPEVRCVSLAETLGAINRAGLAQGYKQMYEDYHRSGIFQRETLRAVATATGTRYLLQLKLAAFGQGSENRWGFLGVRLVDTKSARVRLFVQLWDSADGTIAWEGVEELSYAFDTREERAATFRAVVSEAAQRAVGKLP